MDKSLDRGLALMSAWWYRHYVLAVSIAVWSGMTALCGTAVNFATLFATRVGTAIGEAGGTALGNFVAGQAVQAYGWRTTFVLVGLPGLLVAALVYLTIKEPPRGFSDHAGTLRPTLP